MEGHCWRRGGGDGGRGDGERGRREVSLEGEDAAEDASGLLDLALDVGLGLRFRSTKS